MGAGYTDRGLVFTLPDGQRHIGERSQSTEALFDIADLEQLRRMHQLWSASESSRLRRLEGHRPAGR